MKNSLRHIITAIILLSVAGLAVAQPKQPNQSNHSTPAVLTPTYQAEVIQKTGSDPYLLALVGTVLVSTVGLVVWVVRGNKKTIDKMIDGAEKRAAEDREMYRTEQKLERESHERIVNSVVDKITAGLDQIATRQTNVENGQAKLEQGQNKLEREVHELRGRLEV